MGKFVLYLAALVFIGYGLACWVSPEIAANAAGLTMTSGDAAAEIGAMYGGLQTGFGVMCLCAARQHAYYRAGLWALLLGIGFLAMARVYSALTVDGELGAYTYGAIAFESVITALAALALRARPAPAQ